MELAALIVIQLLATAAVFGLIWRKLDSIGAEVAHIKRMLETLELMRFSSAAQKRAAQHQPARAEPALAPAASEPASNAILSDDDPFSAAWVRPGARVPRDESNPPMARPAPQRTPAPRHMMANEIGDDLPAPWRTNVTPETGRLIAAVAMIVAPALGFAFGAPAPALIACGLSISAALMLTALRPIWAAAAFVGAFGAGGWAVTAFSLDAAQSAPAIFSAFAALAGCAGLAHTRLRGMAPGLMMALLMGGALISLGNAVGLGGPAGLAYGAIVAAAAFVGASATRLAGLHLGAFAAAMFGLYVFSGQEPAAIWFTPVTAWIGALFLAIAAIRTPMLGSRGPILAATGVTAPLLSAGALSLSQHGLANPLAAAGAFLSLAIMFGALIVIAAQRGQRGIGALKLTAWILLGGAAIAFLTAALLALPFAFAATAAAGAALGLVAIDHHKSQRLWRAGALFLFIAAAMIAWAAVKNGWPDALTLAAALAAPTLIAAGAAFVSEIRTSKGAAAVFEAFAIIGAAASLTALARLLLSGGAPNQTPIGFVEVGVHLALWAGAALALAARTEHGARLVRSIGAALFGVAALCGAALAGLLWLTPFWSAHAPSGVDWALLQHPPLGFALPAIIAWMHWAHWRARGVHVRTRVSLASAALLTAAFITLETFGAREGAAIPGQPDWILIGATAAAFGLAVAINFAPGVTDETSARLRFDKYFQRNRRREQRI
jgi:hypothetical protein